MVHSLLHPSRARRGLPRKPVGHRSRAPRAQIYLHHEGQPGRVLRYLDRGGRGPLAREDLHLPGRVVERPRRRGNGQIFRRHSEGRRVTGHRVRGGALQRARLQDNRNGRGRDSAAGGGRKRRPQNSPGWQRRSAPLQGPDPLRRGNGHPGGDDRQLFGQWDLHCDEQASRKG